MRPCKDLSHSNFLPLNSCFPNDKAPCNFSHRTIQSREDFSLASPKTPFGVRYRCKSMKNISNIPANRKSLSLVFII